MSSDEILHVRLTELLDLEWNRQEQADKTLRKEFDGARARLIIEHVQQGWLGSYTIALILAIWQDYREKVVNQWLDIRRELAIEEPALGTAAQLDRFSRRVEKFIMVDDHERQETALSFAVGLFLPPTGDVQIWAESSKERDYTMLSTLRNRVNQLTIEIRQGIHKPKEPRIMKFELHNSTIHQLNLGTIEGDMNNAVATLTQKGEVDVAIALKEITERVAGAEELVDTTKKDILENLAFIAQQATLPVAERQQGPVTAILSHIQTALQVVGSLTQIWNTYSPVILAFFQNH